jgi:ATP-dependent Clp protease ATP-binding subunit ClpA
MQLANQEAQRLCHEYIGTEHILLGLVREGSGVAANVLKNLHVDLRDICLERSSTQRCANETPRLRQAIDHVWNTEISQTAIRFGNRLTPGRARLVSFYQELPVGRSSFQAEGETPPR